VQTLYKYIIQLYSKDISKYKAENHMTRTYKRVSHCSSYWITPIVKNNIRQTFFKDKPYNYELIIHKTVKQDALFLRTQYSR
ncbi:MAG: hypothetical protein ACUVRK_13115, partial [Spirochaetota bacterium]